MNYAIINNKKSELLVEKEGYFHKCRKERVPYITIEKIPYNKYQVSFDHISYPSDDLLDALVENQGNITNEILDRLKYIGYLNKKKKYSVSCSYSRIVGLDIDQAKFLAEEFYCLYKPYFDKLRK